MFFLPRLQQNFGQATIPNMACSPFSALIRSQMWWNYNPDGPVPTPRDRPNPDRYERSSLPLIIYNSQTFHLFSILYS